jgi:hypothetical protein
VLLFLSIFGFVGIAVLIFLWGPGDGFDSPPLIFRVIGSFIALGFMLMGFGAPLSLMQKRKGIADTQEPMTAKSPPATQLACPSCGANLGGAEVSPSGDVKCSYCKGWFNVHGR